jgi:hypothetical protein
MTNFTGTADLNRAHPVTQNPEGSHRAAISSACPLVKGMSERTKRRQKKALTDLQAQGFQTLPDFFRKKAEDADKKAKFEAMVASVKAKLKALQAAEEEEASSGTETETKDEHDFEVISEPDTSQVRSPDIAATLHSRGATLEPGGAKEMTRDPVVWTAQSSGTTCRVKEEGAINGHISLNACQESSCAMLEEEEEESDDNRALDKRYERGNGCATEEQRNIEDVRDKVSRMLEDLRRGNDPEDDSHLQPADSPLELLRDHVAMQMAQEKLASLEREKKSGDFVHSRILAMEAVLNIFLDQDLEFTWTKASIIVAKTQGCGKTCAQTI